MSFSTFDKKNHGVPSSRLKMTVVYVGKDYCVQ